METDLPETIIGKRFGENGHLEVVGWDGVSRRGGSKLYTVKCYDCAKDHELYGEALFKATRRSLERGIKPCGCNGQYEYSNEQYAVRVKRECSKRDITFIGFVSSGKIAFKDYVILKCNKDGHEWDTCTIFNLFKGRGCPKCQAVKTSKRQFVDDETHIKRFISSGAFAEGTQFKRLKTKTPNGTRFWAIWCPICSNDEYVKAGVCTGVFVSEQNRLSGGNKPCRCSNRYAWPQEQMEYRVRKLAAEESIGTKFLGWAGPYEGNDTIANMWCEEHGEFSIKTAAFIHKGSRCQSCAKSGFNQNLPGSLYVIKAESVVEGFCGYGISNVVHDRLSVHKNTLNRHGFAITDIEVFDVGLGSVALSIENSINHTFPRNGQDISGFRREATHCHLYEDVVAHVKSMLESQPYQHEGVIH